MRIIDKSGIWVRNTGDFRLPLYDRVGDAKFLEPGENTKVEMTPFLQGQAQVVEVENPEDEPAPVKKGK